MSRVYLQIAMALFFTAVVSASAVDDMSDEDLLSAVERALVQNAERDGGTSDGHDADSSVADDDDGPTCGDIYQEPIQVARCEGCLVGCAEGSSDGSNMDACVDACFSVIDNQVDKRSKDDRTKEQRSFRRAIRRIIRRRKWRIRVRY